MAISYYFYGTSKSGFAKREGKYGLLMHAPIPAAFSLLFLPLSFFLSVLSLLLVSYYYPSVGCSLFGLLGRPLGLAFHWAFLRIGFWIRIRKNGHQQILTREIECLRNKLRF